MRILIIDGNRHMQATGYGQLARSIILSLYRYSNHEIYVQKRQIKWVDLPHRRELEEILESEEENVDLIIRVGAPSFFLKSQKPTLFYTQNALGDLRSDWVEWLRQADGVIVPGQFDYKVFSRYFKKVFVCPQNVDESNFRPVEKYRDEYSDRLRFLYVGSFSFRKGVDILFQSFSKAFDSGQKVDLSLHCFSGMEKNGVNNLLRYSRDLPGCINLNVFNGVLSPAWMNRIYNQNDVVVTFSRGEGWCMPIHEGLLCEKPVIAPDSTAMGEALPFDGVRRVRVDELNISGITSEFGSSLVSQYGANNNFLWEPNLDDSINALRDLHSNYDFYKVGAKKARPFILHNYSLKKMAENLTSAVDNILS